MEPVQAPSVSVAVRYPLVPAYVWRGAGKEEAVPLITHPLSDGARVWISQHDKKTPLYQEAVYALQRKGILVGIDCCESFSSTLTFMTQVRVRKRNSSQSNKNQFEDYERTRLEQGQRTWYVFVDSNDSTKPQRVSAIRHALYLSDFLKIPRFLWGELEIKELFLDNYIINRVEENKDGLEHRLAELTSKAA